MTRQSNNHPWKQMHVEPKHNRFPAMDSDGTVYVFRWPTSREEWILQGTNRRTIDVAELIEHDGKTVIVDKTADKNLWYKHKTRTRKER
jgi:hypothetical protein